MVVSDSVMLPVSVAYDEPNGVVFVLELTSRCSSSPSIRSTLACVRIRVVHATVTSLVAAWRNGNEDARDQLFAVVYDELRKLANSTCKNERHCDAVQPTALVDEAYLRLAMSAAPDWEGRVHLMAAFAAPFEIFSWT
ncbi:MAG: ECF-type sigma factor [Bryobacteraceae bacterium]